MIYSYNNCFKSLGFFLYRWRFVIHGGIDGYSRLPVFLKVNTNNTAHTVLQAFQEAVSTYGLPECVRSDKGAKEERMF